jgi:hypothetical protein
MANVTDFLIIDNKDYGGDDYLIESGKFVADFAVVSTLALSCVGFDAQTQTIDFDYFYIPIPSKTYNSPIDALYSIKYETQGRVGFTQPKVSLKSKPASAEIFDVSPNNCSEITQGSYTPYISSHIYTIRTVQDEINSFIDIPDHQQTSISVLGYNILSCEPNFPGVTCNLPSCYSIADPAVTPSDFIVGGRGNTGDPLFGGVDPCLIIPTEGDGNKTFTNFTLYGGVEVPRVTLFAPPTALLIVTLSSSEDNSTVTKSVLIDYYETSSKILNTNNQVDSWYVDITGFMWPNQYLYEYWDVKWSVRDLNNEAFQLSANYINRDTDQVGSFFDLNGVGAVDPDPTLLNEQIDYLRVYSKTPGKKVIEFSVMSGAGVLPEPVELFTHSLTTDFFNNKEGIRVNYVDTNNDNLFLSAVSFFDNEKNDFYLDSTYPNIRWLWEDIDGNLNPLGTTLKSVKTGSPISHDTAVDASLNDYIVLSSTVANFYSITAINDISGERAVYFWPNFTPTNLKLEYEYDNCPNNRFISISALTTFGSKDILFDGLDKTGDPVILKWGWDTNNINARSETKNIRNNSINVGQYSNLLRVNFNDPSSLTKVLCSTTFSVSTNFIVPPNNKDSVSINYDLLPKGFEIDFDINYENSSDINNVFYRITEDDTYYANFTAKIKPEDATGWLTDSETNNLNLQQPSTMFWYVNGDKNNVISVGANGQQSFDLLADPFHISSVTFVVSCLSASPNFGYGHTLEKTSNLRIYKDSFIPDLKTIVYPEYYFRLPSTPSIKSTRFESYWVETPYPSAYGEGRSNVFFASAFSDDYSGPSWDNFFEESKWYFNNFTNPFTTIQNQLLELVVPSTLNNSKSDIGLVGSFKGSIGLLNQSLSTYKSDSDGSTQTFKNWKIVNDPILTTVYDKSSSQDIIFNVNIPDNNTLNYEFSINLKYPNYSPVKENKNFQIVNWTILSDTGQDFSGVSTSGEKYIVFLSPQTNIRKLFVQASVDTKEYIPNLNNFTLNYPLRDIQYQLPEKEISVSVVDFTLSALDTNCVIDNSTQTITAFAPVDLEGIILTTFNSYTYEWVVDGVNLGTDVPFLTSFEGYSNYPSNPNYLGPIIPLNLKLDNGDLILEKFKFLHVNPPIELDWRVFPNIIFVETGKETYFYNDTKSPIPLSAFLYRFDDEDSIVQVNYGDFLFKTFETNGNKNLYVSAIDYKGFVHETILNNIVTVQDEFNVYLEDQFVGDELQIKHPFEELKIQSNEWAIDTVINDSINKLYENLIYLENVSKFYKKPPFELIGWYGAYQSEFKWNMNPHDSNYNFVSEETNTPDNLISYRVINEDLILLAYKDKIEIRENNYNTNLLESRDERSVNDSFVDIKNAVTDSDGKIIILDATNYGTVTIYEYNPLVRNSFKFITTFGGLGGEDSKYKFNNANDLTIDSNDFLFIADTGNKVIKQFTNTGGFKNKFKSTIFNPENTQDLGTKQNGSVISASNGNNNILYALTNRYVVLFDTNTGEEISNFDWLTLVDDLTPVKIVASADDNIVYIVCEEKVVKLTKDGLLIGFLGEYPQEYETNVPEIKYSNMFHFNDRTAYLVSSKFVLKYADFLTFLFIKADLQDSWWQLDSLKINEYEFVEYWVYNKSFSRLWDNLEFFRKSLLARVLFSFDINGKLQFNLYRRDDIYKPPYTFKKEDILIGVNELVTTEVINRSLYRLSQCSLELLDMITSQQVRYRWIDTIKVGFNPLRWYESKNREKEPLRWGEAIS